MNDIQDRQNSADGLRLLKAQRRLYTLAKRYSTIDFFISVPLIVIFSLISVFFTGFEVWYAYTSIVVLGARSAVRAISDSYRGKGAAVQNKFDEAVLDLKPNNFLVSSDVPLEEIKLHADNIAKNDDYALRDWYPAEVDQLPLAYARIVCQRANCYWNFSQRRIYLIGLIILSVAAIAIVVGSGLTAGITVGAVLLYVVTPALPMISWGSSEIVAHSKSIRDLRNLYDKFEQILSRMRDTPTTDEELTIISVQFQDALFVRRSNDPLVPGFVYWLMRERQEDGMRFSAQQLVDDIRPQR